MEQENKMFRALFLGLLLLYFWYFYTPPPPVPKPAGPPPTSAPAPPYSIEFYKSQANTFQFSENRTVLWEHALPDEFLVRKGTLDIIPRDACHYVTSGQSIPATGRVLYDYLKLNPHLKDALAFQQDTALQPLQTGTVFYFKCRDQHIEGVGMCPSGTVFQKGRCLAISACTGRVDGTLLPHSDPQRAQHGYYVKCVNGRETQAHCGAQKFFFHDRCVSESELLHLCQFQPDQYAVFVDAWTRVRCQQGRPVYERCAAPETQFFEKDVCESSACVGRADGERVGLPERTLDPFRYVPGYHTCYQGKVQDTVECPALWDAWESRGDDLTHLPMVLEGQQCSIPSFCENVFASDPDTIVPSHAFTKHVQNWEASPIYDRLVGYMCHGGGGGVYRKRKRLLPPGTRISKRFKEEPACDAVAAAAPPQHLPIPDKLHQYYDCGQHMVIDCPADEFFNGARCIPRPEHAFTYQNLPLFTFDSLNSESWIKPWDYGVVPAGAAACTPPESTHIKLYNICAHPDCAQYDFLASLPDLAIHLSVTPHQCRYNEQTHRLSKEPLDAHHPPTRFWDQRRLRESEPLPRAESCTPGQHLKTGNFIWDSTVYATCQLEHPFVFCPSVHTDRLIPVDQYYACAPPPTNIMPFTTLHTHVPFTQNEIQRILPIQWNPSQGFKLNKGMRAFQPLDNMGYTIAPGTRVNLNVNEPVNLELHHRVTHPPHVAFEYDAQQQLQPLHTLPGRGFLMRTVNFTDKFLNFPRYTPEKHVDEFKDWYLD